MGDLFEHPAFKAARSVSVSVCVRGPVFVILLLCACVFFHGIICDK